jgi:hypothetical protein
MGNAWFQEEGAMAYTAKQSMTFLWGVFSGYMILQFGEIPWPPRSPDFFLQRYLNSKVCITAPTSSKKDHIT